MQVYSRTHKGLVRPTNQDAVLIHDHLIGVADGMGGQLGGEVASNLAVQVVDAMLANKTPSETALRIGVEAANRRVYEKQRFDFKLKGMGTTLTLLWETDLHMLVAHVGDSRGYRLRGGKLAVMTEDHSLVGELLRSRTITQEEAKTHPYRNVITRAIGTAALVEVDIARLDKRPGDVWLVCSDGLFNKIEDSEIERILRETPANQAADRLLELTLERGAEDNVTVLLGYVPEANHD